MRRQESWFPNRFTIGPVTKPGTAALDVLVSDGRRPSGRFRAAQADHPVQSPVKFQFVVNLKAVAWHRRFADRAHTGRRVIE